MTGPAPGAWCVQLAAALADAARRAGALAGRIEADWPDGRGRERAERLTMLQRALARESDVADALGARVAAAAEPMGQDVDRTDKGSAATPPIVAALHALARLGAHSAGTGARLPGTEATRTPNTLGLQLPGTDGQAS